MYCWPSTVSSSVAARAIDLLFFLMPQEPFVQQGQLCVPRYQATQVLLLLASTAPPAGCQLGRAVSDGVLHAVEPTPIAKTRSSSPRHLSVMHFEPWGSVWWWCDRLGGSGVALQAQCLQWSVGSRHSSRMPGRLRGWRNSMWHVVDGTDTSLNTCACTHFW
jgi:hypothetical protein